MKRGSHSHHSTDHGGIRAFLHNILPFHWVVGFLFILLAGAVALASLYGYRSISALSEQVLSLETQMEMQLASTTALLQENIEITREAFSKELSQERQNVAAVQERLGNFQQQVGTLSGTLTDLEKLSKTDPELLRKYSKVFFLNEHYMPERLMEVPTEFKYYEDRTYQVHAGLYPYLTAMLNAARQNNIDLYVFSAYRSFDEQHALKGHYTMTYGAGTANQFSADQGYSEHQLGTAVDFMTTGIGGTLSGFGDTTAYQWLRNNAHRFGFTLSYPEGNDYYVYEPWHWRFVGVALATNLHNTGRYFYDLEQREIDEHLVNIFD